MRELSSTSPKLAAKSESTWAHLDALLQAVEGQDACMGHAALILALDAYPELDIGEELARLDRLALPLQSLAEAESPQEQAQRLTSYLYDRLGFFGNEEDYYDPRNSYLNEVLTRRTGIPITLAVLLMSLGRRCGIEVDGIGFPGHFLVRVGGERGVLVDPFFGGRILSAQALQRLAARFLGEANQLRPEHLEAVDGRSMIVRMLVNLKHAYERRRDHARALVACDRLVDLTEGPTFRRDRGLHALALGASAAAVADLEAYLDARPNAADSRAVMGALERARNTNDRLNLQ